MTLDQAIRKILKTLSFGKIDVESSRTLANIKAIDPLKVFHKTIDYKVSNKDYKVPVRIYLPDEKTLAQDGKKGDPFPILLFFHGGGWVTDGIENYERICAKLARDARHIVISVEYRLAPEHKFPIGLEDCYAVAKAIFTNQSILKADPNRITLIGDSAGGNLTAALSLMAKDRKEFMPKRQILIYPATNNDYTEHSQFPSVMENGTDYLLTARKMRDYIQLYKRTDADLQNPYFAPILSKDLSGQPKTLIMTSEFDPLRDEGEAYGKRLEEAGNEVEMHRIKGALHGFFGLGMNSPHVQESLKLIREFLREV
ncbi:MAG: alpha/beta hydrolase [Lachnospiraceae bacterium]